MKIQWGISTACMYPQPIEKTLRLYVESGISSTELFINTCSEFSPAFVRKYKAILKGGETQVVSVHPFTSAIEGLLLFSEYKRRFTEGMEFYKKYFHFAAEIGAKFVVLHGLQAFQRNYIGNGITGFTVRLFPRESGWHRKTLYGI